jgi:XTP/dITP diphosphohydrolase
VFEKLPYMTRLIIATSNQGKLREIKELLKGINFPIISLVDLDRVFNIKEDGNVFLENAIKKTIPISAVYPDDLIVGEDSGLEVEALGGAPGVYSKRFSGKGATDFKNNQKLLKALEGLPSKKRKAKYQCWMVLAKNTRIIKIFNGQLPGVIDFTMKGENGFGYDPLFYLPKYKKTAAQLPLVEKNKISHRGKAFSKLKKYLLLHKFSQIAHK